MNIQEGSRRMQRAGMWLFAIPVVIVLLIVVIGLASDFERARDLTDFGFRFRLFFICFPLVIPGVALWVAGWILEGFNKNAH
jgi:hypothetical protein